MIYSVFVKKKTAKKLFIIDIHLSWNIPCTYIH